MKHDDVIAQLETVSEMLADRALDVLREAAAAGAATRPEEERRLTQARRAIEKAVGVLRTIT
jgi:hypothetical protein